MTTIRLVLTLRDGLFLQDGHSWGSSTAGQGRSLDWPFPPTLLGALCSAGGRLLEQGGILLNSADDWKRETESISLNTMLPLRRSNGEEWSQDHRMWPMPADASYLEGSHTIHWLQPEPPKLSTLGWVGDANSVREKLWRPPSSGESAKPESSPPWWTEKDWVDWLLERPVSKQSESDKIGLKLPRRSQVHVGIDRDTFSAREGYLFSTEIVETLGENGLEWAISLQAEMPASMANIHESPFLIGGNGKIARADTFDNSLFAMPKELTKPSGFKESEGLRLIAVTPALFEQGWIPDGFYAYDNEHYRGLLNGITEELFLKAAYVSKPSHLSGWDMAKDSPKPTLRLVPPGSVYFFCKVSGNTFTSDELHQLWLTTLGTKTEEGLGRFVPGLWTNVFHPQGETP